MAALDLSIRPEREPPATVAPTSPLRAVVIAALTQRHRCGYSRAFIRDTVMAWAAKLWPDVLAGRSSCPDGVHARSRSAGARVKCSADDETLWTFEGTRHDASGAWDARVVLASASDSDVLTIQTRSQEGDAEGRLRSRPAFLCQLVDHLAFEDGGCPLATDPPHVTSGPAFDRFHQHLLSPLRGLPVLAVGSDDRGTGFVREASDAGTLSRSLCGVAHVVSLGALGRSCLEDRLGSRMAVRSGQARLFLPGFTAQADPGRHPAFVDAEVGLAVQQAAHRWSTSAARRADFDDLWARSTAT